MKQRVVFAIVMLAIILTPASSVAPAIFDQCPPQDNHGRMLFDALVTLEGLTVCRYNSGPQTPPCPVVSPVGSLNINTRAKSNGVIVCVYQDVNPATQSILGVPDVPEGFRAP